MKKIVAITAVILLAYGSALRAEDCSSFARTKIFATTNVVVLKTIMQKAESCLMYYQGFIAATKIQKELLLEEMTREPKNKAVRRLFDKADKELMLAVATEVALSDIQRSMSSRIEDLYDPELPKLRIEM